MKHDDAMSAMRTWDSAILRPGEILVVHYRDPEKQPDAVTLTDFVARLPERLRGRVIVILQPVELEAISRQQRPLLIEQLKELAARLEGMPE